MSLVLFPVQIISDLHVEVERMGEDEPGLYDYRFPVKAENLAVLGDLGCTSDSRFFDWLEVQLDRFRKVFFVPGNHEPYRSSLDESDALLLEFRTRHASPDPEGKGEFILLNRTRYDASAHLTILGCTLWTALNPSDLDILSWSLTDFKRIKFFDPAAYDARHQRDLDWLNRMVEKIRSTEPERRVVIFTHHAPTIEGTGDPRYIGGPTNSAFATELTGEPCWAKPVTVWAFGHTHWYCDFVRGGVRVYSNPRGYHNGAKGFDAERVVEL